MLSARTGGAESFNYSLTQSSFLQLSRTVLSMQGACSNSRLSGRSGTLRKVSILELEQLASRVASAMHAEVSNGDDLFFANVKDLISLMIAQLEEKVSAVDSLKVPCDKELSETFGKKEKKLAVPQSTHRLPSLRSSQERLPDCRQHQASWHSLASCRDETSRRGEGCTCEESEGS